jgi:hypothetical protein
MFLNSLTEVDFKKDTHQYFRNGFEYVSQSKFVGIFEPKFDDRIVHACAKKEGITSAQMQERWDKKRNDASDHGNSIHGPLEDAELGKAYSIEYLQLVDEIRTLTQPCKQVIPEKILYLDDYRIAGTADRVQIRCVQNKRQVIDIFDYKTNISKGITLYSSSYKNDKWNHYPESRFLGPISHMEYSLYHKDCLQLSLYMYMCETNYEMIPGRMGILYINSNLEVRNIPVPYLRYEIIEMLKFYKQLK